jgi:pimeloyl-ACP methyl ester carboxylesterase
VVDRVMVISAPLEAQGLAERAGSFSPTELANRLSDASPAHDAARKEAAKSDPAAIQTSMEALQKLDLAKIFTEMNTAALLVHGTKDPLSPNTEMGDLPNMFHQVTFDESGHFPMLDQPNKFHRLMKDFLDLPSGESPRQLQLKDEWKRRVR